jgi:hypothetical protein
LSIGPVDPCCPTVTFDPLPPAGDCVNGMRKVTASAQVDVTSAPVGATLELRGEGTTIQLEQKENQMSSFGLGGHADVPPGDYTVAVKIDTPSSCPEATLPVTVDPCGAPAQVDRFWPRISWCMILLIAAFLLLLAGTILFTVGFAVLILLPCIAMALVALGWFTAGATVLVLVIICVVIVAAIMLGPIFIMVGLILLVVWAYACGGCDGIRAPDFCNILQKCNSFLMAMSFITIVIDYVFLGVSVILSLFCGGIYSGWVELVPAAIDAGAIAFAIIIVNIVGNGIGCFNSLWWPPFLPKQLPSPSGMLPCLDE